MAVRTPMAPRLGTHPGMFDEGPPVKSGPRVKDLMERDHTSTERTLCFPSRGAPELAL